MTQSFYRKEFKVPQQLEILENKVLEPEEVGVLNSNFTKNKEWETENGMHV